MIKQESTRLHEIKLVRNKKLNVLKLDCIHSHFKPPNLRGHQLPIIWCKNKLYFNIKKTTKQYASLKFCEL